MLTPPGTRRALGQRLRTARTSAELRAVDLAELIGMSQGQISKVENGKRRITPAQADHWATQCDADAATVSEVRDLAQRADTDVTAWADRFAAGWDTDQRSYAEMEQDALSIRLYQVSVVPGLLQTADYTDFILRQIVGLDREQIAAGLQARAERQKLLYQPGTHVSAVIAEHVLRHRFAGRAVMIEQLHRLVQLASLPTVDIAVIPTETDMPLPYMVSFDLLELDDNDGDVVQVELDTGEVVEREPGRVATYQQRHAALHSHALTGADATALVQRIADEHADNLFPGERSQ